MVPVPFQPPLQERASVAVGSTSGQLLPVTSHRSFGRRSVVRRRRALVGRLLVRHRVLFHRYLVVACIGGKAEALLSGILIAFIGGQQVLERRIGLGVGIGDLVLVHLGQHVDVFLGQFVLLELARDAFAIGLRRHLAVGKARTVGNVLVGTAGIEKSRSVELGRGRRGRLGFLAPPLETKGGENAEGGNG